MPASSGECGFNSCKLTLERECCLYSFIHGAQLGVFQHVADGSALVPPFVKDLLAKQDVMPFGVAALLQHQGVDPVAPRDGGAFLALDVGHVHLALGLGLDKVDSVVDSVATAHQKIGVIEGGESVFLDGQK
jgi:hypothetical protein